MMKANKLLTLLKMNAELSPPLNQSFRTPLCSSLTMFSIHLLTSAFSLGFSEKQLISGFNGCLFPQGW